MELSPQTFAELRAVIRRLCGVVVPEEKAYLIQHRLGPVARRHGCRSFAELVTKLRGPQAAQLYEPVIEAITTKETSFFRDGHPFEAFRRHLLPRLAEGVRTRRARARIWCAAASTGQEPYSLAMLVHDYVTAGQSPGTTADAFEILATDISPRALAAATAAEYSERDVARGLTPDQVRRFFQKTARGWVVQDGLRKLVEFRRLNLAQPFPSLGAFDLIFCRNVLIYFDTDTRQQICQRFYDCLRPGGYLLLGSAENLYGVTDRFESLRFGESLVYRKKPAAGPAPPASPAAP